MITLMEWMHNEFGESPLLILAGYLNPLVENRPLSLYSEVQLGVWPDLFLPVVEDIR